MFNRTTILLVIFLLAALTSCNQRCSGPSPSKGQLYEAVVLFTLGKTEGIDKNGTASPLKPRQKILPGESIKTGENSFVTFQLGTVAVIKVRENSTIRYSEDLVKSVSEINVSRGSFLTKVIKLKGKPGVTFSSNILLAAIRGTEFSMASDGKMTTVVLREGKLALMPNREAKIKKGKEQPPATSEEVTLDEGNTARAVVARGKKVLTPRDIRITSMTSAEELEVKKISLVPIMDNPAKKSLNELKQLQEEILEKEKLIDEKLLKLKDQDQASLLIKKKSRTIAEMKRVFSRVSRFQLYNGRTIEGAVISGRGDSIVVLTRTGRIKLLTSDIQNETPL